MPCSRSAIAAGAPGQLEDEIKGNGWLTVPFSRDLLFETPIEKRYDAALAQLGITRASLSGDGGARLALARRAARRAACAKSAPVIAAPKAKPWA